MTVTNEEKSPAAVVYPDYYKAADIEQIELINQFLAQPGNSFGPSALARWARISPSALSQIRSGKYASSPAAPLAKVMAAMTQLEKNETSGGPVVETDVFRLVRTACGMARLHHNFSIISFSVGTGKTFAIKDYSAKNPNTFLIEATPTMDVSTLINLLAHDVAKFSGKGTKDTKFRAVIDAIQGTDTLLIIDEADTLSPKLLEVIRRLRDMAGIGVVLAGTENLTGLIKPQHGQFDQIRSRCGFWPPTISGISQEDAGALVQAHFAGEDISDEFVERLYKYSKGSARMLCEGLISGVKAFRKDNDLTPGLVDSVAKQVLYLHGV